MTGVQTCALPISPTRVIPVRAEQDLEHYICNELVNVATHSPTSEGWNPESSHLPGSGVEPLNCMIEHALESGRLPTELARQTIERQV